MMDSIENITTLFPKLKQQQLLFFEKREKLFTANDNNSFSSIDLLSVNSTNFNPCSSSVELPINSSTNDNRNFVLNLKRLNTTWGVGRMVHFIQSCDNPPPLKYKSLHKCISRILKRGTVKDKKRSGRPVTTTTFEFQQSVNYYIKMKKGASIRKTNAILKNEQFESSPTSVYRTTKQLNLKWYKKRKAQKLTDTDTLKRIKCAKRLQTKFGITKKSKKWKWNRVVNCDFSGVFPLQGFQNKKNYGLWAEKYEEIEADLLNAETNKFQQGVIFWGAISSQGLIPSNAPINVTECQLYAKFLKEKVAPAIKTTFRKSKLDPIFHDDQDQKQQTKLVINTVAQLFHERIQPVDGDAKFDDVWRIENVWRALKEKVRGE
ncbi:unnamed protein product, partial [Rotaria sordida]